MRLSTKYSTSLPSEAQALRTFIWVAYLVRGWSSPAIIPAGIRLSLSPYIWQRWTWHGLLWGFTNTDGCLLLAGWNRGWSNPRLLAERITPDWDKKWTNLDLLPLTSIYTSTSLHAMDYTYLEWIHGDHYLQCTCFDKLIMHGHKMTYIIQA